MTISTIESPVVRHDRVTLAPRGIIVRAAFAWTKENPAAVQERRLLPIRCYLGRNGSGKTLCAVRDLLPSLDAGRTVYSTVPLYGEDGELHPSYVPWQSWAQFMHADHADFLADEISSIAASRDHNSLDSEVISRTHQQRKIDTTFSWTAPSWKRADVSLREVTWAVTECAGYFPVPAGPEQLWPGRRLFRFETYDMRDYDEWSQGKKDRDKPEIKEWFKGEGSRAFSAYRTLDAVGRLERYDPRACPVCAKTKRAEYCKGHD
jgi:hypothetical protein